MDDLCDWLYICVSEVRKEDGAEYTPRSISQFVAGLQRYINERKPAPVRLADASNPTFRPLHTALDKRYCQLHTQGVGTKRKQAEVVSNHEEQQLWERGVLSSESPSGLLRAVFYLNGITFVLRGGEEHRSLKISQFIFLNVPDPDNAKKIICCVEYAEHGSKNRPRGSHQINQDNKIVTQFAREDLGDRCHIFLLELYLSKLPVSALQNDVFYMSVTVWDVQK